MKPFPNKTPLANLPTKIEKLERFSEQTGISVYIKRDDLTGMEYSGNKIRKLEYAVREALDQGADEYRTVQVARAGEAAVDVQLFDSIY